MPFIYLHLKMLLPARKYHTHNLVFIHLFFHILSEISWQVFLNYHDIIENLCHPPHLQFIFIKSHTVSDMVTSRICCIKLPFFFFNSMGPFCMATVFFNTCTCEFISSYIIYFYQSKNAAQISPSCSYVQLVLVVCLNFIDNISQKHLQYLINVACVSGCVLC